MSGGHEKPLRKATLSEKETKSTTNRGKDPYTWGECEGVEREVFRPRTNWAGTVGGPTHQITSDPCPEMNEFTSIWLSVHCRLQTTSMVVCLHYPCSLPLCLSCGCASFSVSLQPSCLYFLSPRVSPGASLAFCL